MDKLNGIKPGDRVRVTFEGVVVEVGGDWLGVTVDGGDTISCTFSAEDIKSPHFHIERIEKPLAVGDRVKETFAGFGAGEVLCVDGEFAFVRWDTKAYGPASIRLSKLERIS